MKFTCTKEHLDRALRYSAKAVAKHSTLPIIQNVLFSVENGTIMCAATNLDVGVRISIGGKAEDDGTAVVPPQLITSFIAAVDVNAQVVVEKKADQSIVLTSGTSRAVVKGFDPTDFPIIPQKDAVKNIITVSADAFRTSVSRAVISVAKTEARPELTGVNMIFERDGIRVAATDGFRLSECVVALDGNDSCDDITPVIIPASAIAEVLYVLSDSGVKTMTMHMSDGQIFFDVDDVTIVSRLIAGSYPDYQQIIPKDTVTRISIDRTECERVLRLADAFANQTTSDMQLIVDPAAHTCTVNALSQDRGENTTTLTVDGSGDQQEMYLNTRYVLDGVSRCGTDRVCLSFSGPSAPVIISPDTDDAAASFLYLVMPIRK